MENKPHQTTPPCQALLQILGLEIHWSRPGQFFLNYDEAKADNIKQSNNTLWTFPASRSPRQHQMDDVVWKKGIWHQSSSQPWTQEESKEPIHLPCLCTFLHTCTLLEFEVWSTWTCIPLSYVKHIKSKIKNRKKLVWTWLYFQRLTQNLLLLRDVCVASEDIFGFALQLWILFNMYNCILIEMVGMWHKYHSELLPFLKLVSQCHPVFISPL